MYIALVKTKNFLNASLVIVLGFLLGPGCSTVQRGNQAGTGTARIRSIDGHADVARGEGPWQPAHLWETLHSGDRARTAGNGKIDFSLGKMGGVLTLMSESMITFEQLGRATPDAPLWRLLI